MHKQWIVFLINVWLLSFCAEAQQKTTYHLRHFNDENGLPQNSVKSIIRDNAGFIWLATEDGLVRFDGARFVRFGQETLPITTNRICFFYTNAQGEIRAFNDHAQRIQFAKGLPFIDSLPGEIVKYEPGTLPARQKFEGIEPPLPNIVSSYYDEASGQIYLGSSTNGLYILTPQPFVTLTATTGTNVYYGQTVFTNNTILTAQGYVLGRSSVPHRIKTIADRVPSDAYSIITDRAGFVWVKYKYWLYKLHPVTHHLLGEWRFEEEVSAVYEDLQGKLWIGFRKGGMYTMEMKNGKPWFRKAFSTQDGICYLARATSDSIYIGTEKGLYIMSVITGKVDSIQELTGMYIRSIYVPNPNEVWITTYSHGFFLYKNKKLSSFPPDKNKYLNTTHCMVEDKKGFLWVTTNKGLFQMAKADLLEYAAGNQQELYYHYYDKSAGFYTNEFNGGCQPCFAQLKNGDVSFPSLNGLVLFNPDSIRPILPVHNIYIDKIELDKKALPLTPEQHLPRYFGQLNIHVSTPCLGNEYNTALYYAIDNKKDSLVWLPVSEQGLVTITALPAGNYTLHIRKLNGFGKNNYTSLSVQLNVAAAWHETNWFYIGLIVCVAVFCWLFSWLRVRYIKRRNALLEERIALKTKELRWQTSIQEKIIRSISHDIQTPLQYQVLLSNKLYDGLKTGNNFPIIAKAKAMSDHSHRLYYMVENLLNYLKGQTASRPGAIASFDLAALVTEKLKIFEAIAFDRGTVIHNTIPPGTIIKTDAQLLNVILHNLIDNAVKVTKKGRITVNAGFKEGRLYITVEDTGPGIKDVLQQWINQPFDNNSSQSNASVVHASAGIGLVMVKELAALLHFSVQVKVTEGAGTCFTLQSLS